MGEVLSGSLRACQQVAEAHHAWPRSLVDRLRTLTAVGGKVVGCRLIPHVNSHTTETTSGAGGFTGATLRTVTRHVLVLADSLAFHGPERPELLTEPRLYPHVLAAALTERTGERWEADVVARLGATARDGWWWLTKDPHLYSTLLPRADAVVLGLGNFDQLPAAVPTWLREGIAYLRPGSVRRRVRRGFHAAHPHVVRWVTRGRLRALPQVATDHYLARSLAGIRHYRPGVPAVGFVPYTHRSAYHAFNRRGFQPAQRAARAWGERHDVPMLELWPLVRPDLEAGRLNPDGMHFSWGVHRSVGVGLADLVSPQLPGT